MAEIKQGGQWIELWDFSSHSAHRRVPSLRQGKITSAQRECDEFTVEKFVQNWYCNKFQVGVASCV